jgi:hypothetical protein
MSKYVRQPLLPLRRRPARIPDPGQMVDLQMEDASWRQGFRALSAPSTAETGEVLIWVCTEDEYREALREERRAVGMPWPAKRMRVSPSPTPGAYPTGTGERGVDNTGSAITLRVSGA